MNHALITRISIEQRGWGIVYTIQGNQGNQGKIREFHVAWKMSGENQGIRCLVRKNQGNQ